MTVSEKLIMYGSLAGIPITLVAYLSALDSVRRYLGTGTLLTAWLGAFAVAAIILALGANAIIHWPRSRHHPDAQRVVRAVRDSLNVDDAQPQKPAGSGWSAEQILEFVNAIKNISRKCPVKIVSIDEWRPVSRILVSAFQVAGFEVMINEQNSTWIFSAATKHWRVVFRSRPADITGKMICLGLIDLVSCDVQDFPDTEAHNFVQVEVGGSP